LIYKNRKSIRLKHYDYANAGLYFLTICVHHRLSIFGKIDNGVMVYNDAGRMIERWYLELENKFKTIRCHDWVVMPNHFHCIVEIADNDLGEHRGRHIGLPLHNHPIRPKLGEIVQWFKTMTTNAYIRGVKEDDWQPFEKKMWQRNYWEHIIRNETSYLKLIEYIQNNPQKWELDALHPDNMEIENVK
jgi:putative transposase